MAVEQTLFQYFLRDNLREYSENFQFTDRTAPFRFSLNGIRYALHVSSIHFAKRQNPDEFRIQVDRTELDQLKALHDQGEHVSFLGVFDGGEAFVGWEPRYGFSLTAEQRVSLYCRQSQLASVEENLNAIYTFRSRNLGDETSAIALPPSALGFYLENTVHFHALPSENAISRLLNEYGNKTLTLEGLGDAGEIDVEEDEVREKFTYERKAYPRDPRFKKWIMDAYGKTCCVCDRQLELIQAAHIIPHSVEDSPNTVQNGLAMCIEHHRLYDDALLLPGPGQQLVFNKERAEYLKQTNQDKGLDGIAALAEQQYQIPNDAALQPKDDFLQKGLDIRLGG